MVLENYGRVKRVEPVLVAPDFRLPKASACTDVF